MTPDMKRLLHLIQARTPAASVAGIKAEIYEAIDEFFRDSSSWVEIVDIPTVAGTTEYAVTVTNGGQPLRLWGVVDPNKLGVGATMPTVGTVTLAYPPPGNQTFKAAIVKKLALPLDDDDLPVIPEFLLQLYSHVILDGVLGKMFGQQNKPYTNDALMTYHMRRFRDGIAQARAATLRSNTFGTQNWQYPQNFRVSSQRGGVSTGNPTRF